MKKLMTMIAAVAMSFGLFADGATPFSISFEAAEGASGTAKGVDVSTMKFTPPAEGWTWGGDPLDMLAYDDDAYDYTTTRRTFDDQDNLNYLKLETSDKELARAMGDGNIFVDQLVKFTGFEEPQTNLVAGTKIAVWMSGTETDETVVGETNLYVTVGQVDADGKLVKQVAFAIDNPADGAEWKTEKWYRLTIKSIGNIFGEGSQLAARAGFIVYIDGVQVATSDEAAKTIVAATGDLSTAAAGYMAKGQLFPAIDAANATFNTVAYKGIGWIDDVVLDDQGPDFCQFVNVTVTEIPGALIKVEQEGEEIAKGEDGKYAVAPGAFTVTYTGDEANGYMPFTKPIDHDTGTLVENTVNDTDAVKDFVKLVIVTVQYDGGDPVKYDSADAALLAVEAYQKGKVGTVLVVEFKQGATNELVYAFDKGTIINISDDSTLAPEQVSSLWNITGGNVTFLTGLNDYKKVTLDATHTLTFAGLMKAGSQIVADQMTAAENAITLDPDSVVYTKNTELIDAFADVEGYEVTSVLIEDEEDPFNGYTMYYLAPIVYVASVTIEGETVNYKEEELYDALAAVQAAVAEGKTAVVTALGEEGLFFNDDEEAPTRWVKIDQGDTITVSPAGWVFSGTLKYAGAIDGAVTAADIEKFTEGEVEDATITLNLTGTVTVGDEATATKELFTCGAGDDYEVVKDVNTFKVQAKAPTTYKITFEVTGGTADKTSPAMLAKDATIVFTATGDNKLKSVTVDDVAQTIDPTAITYTFTVGEKAATVVVVFEAASTDPVEGNLDEKGEDNLADLKVALTAAGTDINAYAEKIYGAGGKIPAAQLNGTTADLIAVSVAYDLPIVKQMPTVTVAAAESTGGAPAFQFTVAADVDINLAKAAIYKIVKYSADLATFGPSTDKVTITVDETQNNVMKAEFVKGPAKGFMKADFTVAE